MATVAKTSRWFETSRGRVLLENLTGYAFITPATLILFIFGIFPVGFAFFVSLHRWRRTADEFRGLDQYASALGNFAYVLFFWLAIGALFFGVLRLRTLITHLRANPLSVTAVFPAAALTAATGTFIA